MKKLDSPVKNIGYLGYRLVAPFFDPIKFVNGISKYPKYIKDMHSYSTALGSEPMDIMNMYPVITDRTTSTPYDSHYFYQDIWAARKVFSSRAKKHYDVGSNIEYVGFLSTFTSVTFVDIRPLEVKLKNFRSIKGDVTDLPFKERQIKSLSCLHVAEHIGLGRYGDRLDPEGTRKACRELSRVLARGGNLYFSLPIGKPRLVFNAHRIHSPHTILEYFSDLKLKELSGVDDKGNFIEKIDIKVLEKSDYACGLFWFTKK